jgi:hypothetical protein
MNSDSEILKPAKHQISILGDRIVEFNKVDDAYIARSWHFFSNVKDFCKFLKDNKIENFPESKISLVTQEGESKIVQIVMVPEYATPLKEVVFNSMEEAQEHIKENSLRPSSSIAPDEYKEQVANFFQGKDCFFEGSNKLRLEFEEEAEKTASGEKAQMGLQMKYENIIIDRLYKLQ